MYYLYRTIRFNDKIDVLHLKILYVLYISKEEYILAKDEFKMLHETVICIDWKKQNLQHTADPSIFLCLPDGLQIINLKKWLK